MLESLSIKNYAIIDESTIQFSPGLNVITGETGAGKSIVVDSLELVLGARASTDMIRAGLDFLEVTGVFTTGENEDPGPLRKAFEDGTLILRREVRSDGNNRCFVNDRPVTLRTLKSIGDLLVDLHGQHDHQSLLVVSEHVNYLDGYGDITGHAGVVRSLFEQRQSLKKELDAIMKTADDSDRDRDLFAFQLDEIEKAAVQPGEDEEIEAALRRLDNARALRELGVKAFRELSENENSAALLIGELISAVEHMVHHDDKLAAPLERLTALADDADDLGRFFREYAENVEEDPALGEEMEERFTMIERLKKKYGPTHEKVFAYRDSIRERLGGADRSRAHIDELQKKLDETERLLITRARELSAERKAAAPRIVKEVEHHLSEMGMDGARLSVDVMTVNGGESIPTGDSAVRINSNGMDYIEFRLAANPGEPPRPLVRVASGGEISRIMLSLKLALMDVNSVPTMVFDEIDVGVSGRVSDALGRKLRRLTANRQAIVITHLPQIAVMGDRHFSARKTVAGDRTTASLILLDNDMRKYELATLLSGENLSETALAHAGELLENARKK